MCCSNSKSRIEENPFPSLPKSNILSTPSAGHRDNCETMLVSGSQTSPIVLLTHAEIPDLLVSPQRNHPPPWKRQHCRECKASVSLMEKPHRAPPLEPVHSQTRGCCLPDWLQTMLRAPKQSMACFHSPGIVHDLTRAQHCQSCIRTISAALNLSNVSPKLPTSEATFFFWKQALHSRLQSTHSCKGN